MIGEIENAMVTRIQSASDGGMLGYKLEGVAPYAGEFSSIDDILREVREFPAVLVTFQKADSQVSSPMKQIMLAEFDVFVFAQSRANEAAARTGGGKPGSYQIARDVRTLLNGQGLGLDTRLELVTVVREFDAKLAESIRSMVRVTFRAKVSEDRMDNPDVAALPAAETLAASADAALGNGWLRTMQNTWQPPLAVTDTEPQSQTIELTAP
jgi:phage gp37-like protein